jgi:hypothetical protein
MDWLWQFGFNMKSPMTIIWVLTLLMSAIVIYDSRKGMVGLTEDNYKYGVLEWRCWTAANTSFVVSVLWLLLMAVPSPTFRTTVVEKPVVKVVEKRVPVRVFAGERKIYMIPTYDNAYDRCIDSYGAQSEGGEAARFCHRQAIEAALPPMRVVTRTITRRDSFSTLFDKCISHMSRGGTSYREDVQTCQMFARGQPIQGR